MKHLSKAELKRKLKDKAGLTPERHILLCTGPNCEPELPLKPGDVWASSFGR